MFLLQAQADTAPWWGSAAIEAIGVLAGIAAKALFDLWFGKRATAETSFAASATKRKIYSDFLAPCSDVGDGRT